MAPEGEPFMQTPLVIAMPKPMAEALGLPRDAGRLGRHPAAGHSDPRAGPPTATPSGARSGSARPTRTSRPAACPPSSPRPTRPPARPSGLSAEDLDKPDHRRVRHRRRVGGRPLRRHHAAPSSTTGTGPTSEGTSLTYASAVAVEEKSVIDYNAGNPDGVARPGRGAPQAAHPARRRSTRRRARSTRTTRSSSSTPPWVDDDGARRGAPLRGVRQAAREPAARCSSSASGRATPTWRSAHPIVDGQRRRPRPAADAARGARRPPVMIELLDQWARAAQERPGAARARRLRARWATWPTRTPARPSSTWPSGRPSRRSTSSRTTTRSASGSSPPIEDGRPTS